MKNLLLLFLLICSCLISCKSTQKASSETVCCANIENPIITKELQIPNSYTRKCGNSQCLQLLGSQDLDCISFKLYTRFGNELVVFQSAIPIRIEDLAKELNRRFEVIKQEGTYFYIATYQMNGQCFRNQGNITIL